MIAKKLKILKTQVGTTVDERGEFHREPRLKVMIETTGALRMVVEIPMHVQRLLGQDAMRKIIQNSGATLEQYNPDGSVAALVGREPDALVNALTRLNREFHTRMKEARVTKVIEVTLKTHVPGDPKRSNWGHRWHDSADFQLEFEVARFLTDGKSTYRWRDEESEPLRFHANGVPQTDKECVAMPYSDELRARLKAIEASLIAGPQRSYDLVFGANLADRLLAAPAAPSLFHDKVK